MIEMRGVETKRKGRAEEKRFRWWGLREKTKVVEG